MVEDHPRLRGEYLFTHIIIVLCKGSPPLARGVLRLRKQKTTRVQDHPRLRGEYSITTTKSLFQKGSPPLARGVRFLLCVVLLKIRITPACAGSTQYPFCPARPASDHPRLRGEYGFFVDDDLSIVGSPPLARGVRFRR